MSILIVGGSAFFMFLTGFRIEVVSIGMVYLACGYVLSKNKGQFVVTNVMAGLVGFLALVLMVGFLPDTVLRSISFLPGIEAGAAIDAITESSGNWRLRVWGYCIKAIPEYLFIGRGLAFDVREWAWLNASVYSTPEFFFGTHSYHNGPLALLLDFGFFGLVTMSWFFIGSARHVLQKLRGITEIHTIYYKFAVYLAVLYIWMIIKFYIFYGDVTYYLARMIILYSMLIATLSYLKQSSVILLKEESHDAVDPE